MPAPMTAPTPRLVSCTGPSTRRSRFSPLSSSSSMAQGLASEERIRHGLYLLSVLGEVKAGGGRGYSGTFGAGGRLGKV